jgi:hypothetical protein
VPGIDCPIGEGACSCSIGCTATTRPPCTSARYAPQWVAVGENLLAVAITRPPELPCLPEGDVSLERRRRKLSIVALP